MMPVLGWQRATHTWVRMHCVHAPQVAEQPVMLAVAELPGLLEGLRGCSGQLDVVERGLNDFLETKKMAFPR